MPARAFTIHLTEVLAKVRAFAHHQERELFALAEKRVPELLRASGKLTPVQNALFDEARAAGLSLNEIRHDLSFLAEVPDAEQDLAERRAKKMFEALGGSLVGIAPKVCRKWGVRKWARFFDCRPKDVPPPALVVKAFDRLQLGNLMAHYRQEAIAQIRAEQLEELGDEYFKTPIWEFTAQKVIAHARIKGLTVDSLGHCVGLIALSALHKPTKISRFLARLDDEGFTDIMLLDLWEKYPAEAQEMGLPGLDGKHASKASQKPAKKANRGRPTAFDWRADRKLAKAWESGQYSSKEKLAFAFGMDRADALAALERDRKRRNGRGRGRNKS